jgi:hypothetical protein
MTYSWNQLRPCGFAALTSSIEVVPRVERVNGMPAAPAAPPRRLALGLHQPGEAGGRDAEGQRRGATEDLRRHVDLGGGAQDVGMELDVLEGLAGARQRQLALRRTIGVVEGGLRRTTLGDRAQVGDREGALETALAAVEFGLELHELQELAGLGQLTLHG